MRARERPGVHHNILAYVASVRARLTMRAPWTKSTRVIAGMWLTAIALDAAITLAMMRTGNYTESNPLAAHGMNRAGTWGYVLAASVLAAAYALLSLGKPRGLPSHAILLTAVGVGVYKLSVGLANVLLWTTGVDIPLPV